MPGQFLTSPVHGLQFPPKILNFFNFAGPQYTRWTPTISCTLHISTTKPWQPTIYISIYHVSLWFLRRPSLRIGSFYFLFIITHNHFIHTKKKSTKISWAGFEPQTLVWQTVMKTTLSLCLFSFLKMCLFLLQPRAHVHVTLRAATTMLRRPAALLVSSIRHQQYSSVGVLGSYPASALLQQLSGQNFCTKLEQFFARNLNNKWPRLGTIKWFCTTNNMKKFFSIDSFWRQGIFITIIIITKKRYKTDQKNNIRECFGSLK